MKLAAHAVCCFVAAAVCGRKWTRRAIGMSAPAEQLQFVWRAARYISLCAKPTPSNATAAAAQAGKQSAELSKLAQLRTQVVEALPAGQRGHFCVSESDLKRLGEEAAAWAAAGGAAGSSAAVSAISLATVGEALEVRAVLAGAPWRCQTCVVTVPSICLSAAGRSDCHQRSSLQQLAAELEAACLRKLGELEDT